jgi:hypothetical protein
LQDRYAVFIRASKSSLSSTLWPLFISSVAVNTVGVLDRRNRA